MNPDRYTRLKAIKEFGYDIEWDLLRKSHIGIVGIGGLGCISAELAARCGIGKISLFDFDTVEVVNLNRHMFEENHIGQKKVFVARKMLKRINPDVDFRCFDENIMNPDFELKFDKEINNINLVLNGLDNIPAREYLNLKCIRFNTPYIDAGASRSGLSGYVHPIIPHKTACSQCINSIGLDLPNERGEPCVASLPSTMGILANIQVQEMLKFLLNFGQLIDYVMYDMISGKLIHYTTQRDKNCFICGELKKSEDLKFKSKVIKSELDNLIDKIRENGDKL